MSSKELPDRFQHLMEGAAAMPSRFPFSFLLALAGSALCLTMVSAGEWEQEVMEPLLRIYYAVGRRRLYAETLVPSLDEESAVESYETGLAVARAHQAIWKAHLERRYKDIETVWKSSTPGFRRKGVSSALNAAIKLIGIVPVRLECPDLTISSLADDNNGRRVIEIARTIVASAIKYPKADNYLSVVSETWDQYFQINRTNQEAEPQLSPSHRHYRTLSEHRRNYFIALFIGCLCHGLSINGTLVNSNQAAIKPRLSSSKRLWTRSNSLHDTTPSPYWINYAEENPSGESSFSMIDLDDEHAEIACRRCARFASEVQELVDEKKEDLYCCSRCRLMDPPRQVGYCGSDCQREDWKTAHKQICGKKLSDLDLPRPSPPGSTAAERPLSIPLQLQLHCPRFPSSDPHGRIWTIYLERSPTSKRRVITEEGEEVDIIILELDEDSRENLDRALTSRSLTDIRNFVSNLLWDWSTGLMTRRKRETIVSQLANEWDVEEETMGKWVREALEEKAEFLLEEYVEVDSEEEEADQVARRENSDL